MDTHRFRLQPYKGASTRHTCPGCHKKRCYPELQRLIDTLDCELVSVSRFTPADDAPLSNSKNCK